jgi:hypothetical protein
LKASIECSRFECNDIQREYINNGRNLDKPIWGEKSDINFNNKILHTSWHPKEDILAVTNKNCIFLYTK